MYTVFLNIDNFVSQSSSESIKIDFPRLDSLSWIPINSSAIGIYWSIENSGASSGEISSLTISNTFNSENDFIYEGSELSGFFIDSLTNSNISIYPNQQIEYTIEWCGLTDCDDSVFMASTFPIYNMQYVPAINDVDFNGNTISTEAFYIDIYEVHENIFNNNDNSFLKPELSNPKTEITMTDAQNYCNSRSNSYLGFQSVYNGGIPDLDVLGFKLPTESEWYVAAAVLYDWDNGSTSIFEYTTQVGSGVINCNYGNILNCGGEVKKVGSYSDNSDCVTCLKSTSPNGLYDCNGNVKEWVEKSNSYPHGADLLDRGVIMGGDFMSPANQSKNNFFIYEDLNFAHPTIGFRTVVLAEPFLNFIYSQNNND